MSSEIAASLLSLPPERRLEGAALAIEAGVDRLHYDLGDGSLGARCGSIEELRDLTRRLSIPIDLHLMARQPSELIGALGGIAITRHFAHPGSEWSAIDALLHDYAERERRAVGLAFTIGEARAFGRLLFARPPGEELLALLVKPGASGATPDPAPLPELMRSLRHLDPRPLWIDGGVREERLEQLLADLNGRPVSLVVGSALFQGPDPRWVVRTLRERLATR